MPDEQKVDKSGRPLKIGRFYHIEGMSHKAYFVLLSVDGNWATVGFPVKTWRKPFVVRYTRLFKVKTKRGHA